MVGALSQSIVVRLLGASVAQPGRCFSTPESIRLVSGKARLSCPAGSRVQTPPEAPKTTRTDDIFQFGFFWTSTYASRDLLDDLGLFSQDVFLSELNYGLDSVRRACYRLLWLFSIRADSPSDKRGKSVSRNRGLEFGIRGDSGRFLLSLFRSNRSCHAKPLNNTPLFLKTISCLAWITGESGRSGHYIGLNAKAKLAIISASPERFMAKDQMTSQNRDQGR